MADLITSARAKYNIAQSSFTSDEDTTIAALVTACSKAVRRFCRREFDSQQFDELHHGLGQPLLVFRQFPVISIERVAYGLEAALRVTNTSASNQRATVRVTSAGLELVRVASGASTTSTLTFAGNATLGALKTAIDALGNGWSATVPDNVSSNRASADLRAVQGALNAKDVTAELRIHLSELAHFEVDAERGFLFRSRDAASFGGGFHHWRVVYTAGFATVPEDVQEACAQWVAALYWQTKRDPGLAHETVAGAGSRSPFAPMPPHVQALLRPYRNYRV